MFNTVVQYFLTTETMFIGTPRSPPPLLRRRQQAQLAKARGYGISFQKLAFKKKTPERKTTVFACLLVRKQWF